MTSSDEAAATPAATPAARSTAASIRRRVTVRGIVQGVGFRPFVWRRATRLGLSGWVENDAAGVTLEVEGSPDAVGLFLDGLAAAPPPLAAIGTLVATDVPPEAAARDAIAAPRFEIRETAAARGSDTDVPSDVAPCAACRAETFGAGRRAAYAFTNCTDCGPRYTIMRALPYDRSRTTMRAFAMCPECAREYADPADRRFHAEPIACPACGPAVWFAEAGAAIPTERPRSGVLGADAIAAARAALRRGLVVAVKGVGGFHLLCDATAPPAVAALRARKRRPGKPLAVMVESVAACAPFAAVDVQEARLLESRERPIVLLRKVGDGRPLAAGISPGNDFVGALLPPSPLHELICAGLPPLVATSGNVADDPLFFDNAAAVAGLAGVADAFLLHDREIAAPCDDSVTRCAAGAIVPIRRGRGHAPLAIPLAGRDSPACDPSTPPGPAVLAVGGELKAALCLAVAGRAILGPHVGDAGSPAAFAALERSAEHLLGLFGAEPAAVAADLHPGSLSAAWAARFAAARSIPLLRVQHHEAHVAALLAEHGIPPPGGAVAAAARPLVCACFDGTGYGPDGTIWGGEFFVVDPRGIRRAAHLEPFPLPGGDACIRHPWRTAAAVLHAAGVGWRPGLPPLSVRSAAGCAVLERQLDRGIACVRTSSMGRLFDGVASLAGVCHSIDHEAEAAMRLETLARGHFGFGCGGRDGGRAAVIDDVVDDVIAAAAAAGHAFAVAAPTSDGAAVRIDWRGLVAAVARDAAAGVPPSLIAARFHAAVAGLVANACATLADRVGATAVGLTGGVFQNPLLLELAVAALRRRGCEVLLHHRVPANDGGLALGQAVLARSRLTPAP
jgi:hydrogenase maturation protein HypF